MQSYEFQTSEKKRNGFYISTACGFGLVLLVLILALGVGILVYFLSPGGDVVCKCTGEKQVSTYSRADELGRCAELAQQGETKICNACITTKSTSASTSTSTDPPSSTTTTTEKPRTTQKPVNKTLSGVTSPYHYNLELFIDIFQPSRSLFKLYGNVSIFINVNAPTTTITFSSVGLNIDNQSLILEDVEGSQSAPSIVSSYTDQTRELYVIGLDSSLIIDRKYVLSLQYDVRLRSNLVGIYYSVYETEQGERRYIASSDFQPDRARRSIPCFDEPRYKATFNTTLIRKRGNYTTWFNTEIDRVEDRGDDFVATIYKTTPVMSTYILAFAVVDYVYLQNVTKTGVKYRTVAKSSGIKNAAMAHSYGIQLFEWFNSNLRPPYPLSKIDNMVIRNRFATAMENWGLVLYKENILMNPDVITSDVKVKSVRLLAHEFAHQWFGNIVTPRTWRDLWLSEGFAVFFEALSIDNLHPSWRQDEYFVVTFMYELFKVDEGDKWPVIKDEVRFDSVTYMKGNCVVRMIQQVLGDDLLMRGLNAHLVKHQYESVELSDLWTSLNEEASKDNVTVDIGNLMEPWLLQKHFPLVTVTRSRSGEVLVSQQLYQSHMTTPKSRDDSPFGYRWNIPLTFLTSTDIPSVDSMDMGVAWLYMSQENARITNDRFPDPSDVSSWVLVNINQTGYYRVKYDERNWLALIKQLDTNYTVIPPVNRAQIIDDAFTFANAGQLNVSIALGTLRFLRYDDDYLPWASAEKQLDNIGSLLENTPFDGAFQAFMADLVKKAYNKYGMLERDLDSPLDLLQQKRMAKFACRYGIQACLNDAVRLFDVWRNRSDIDRIPPDLMQVVNCYGVQEGGLEAWSVVQDIYYKTPDYRFAHQLIPSLACIKEPWLVKRVLRAATDRSQIKPYHQNRLITAVARNKFGRDITWNFIRENFNRLSGSILRDFVAASGHLYRGDLFTRELKMAVQNSTKVGMDYYNGVLSEIRRRENWMTNINDAVTEWLTEMGYGEYIM